MITAKFLLSAGAINALLCVAFGAFGAHALKARLSADMLAIFQTGVQYHVFHALGLLAAGFLLLQLPASSLTRWSGAFMLGGIVLFSGSLYVLSLTGIPAFGAVTPIGGVAFLAAWALLALAILREL